MKPDEIERLLAAERTIEPSPDFARGVMAALERERRLAKPGPLPFPWLTAGLASASGLAVALVLARLPAVSAWEQRCLAALERSQPSPLALAIMACAFTLIPLALGFSFWLARRES
jgi:hypothetical protein